MGASSFPPPRKPPPSQVPRQGPHLYPPAQRSLAPWAHSTCHHDAPQPGQQGLVCGECGDGPRHHKRQPHSCRATLIGDPFTWGPGLQGWPALPTHPLSITPVTQIPGSRAGC